jgi:hypothetical protein
VREGEKTFWQLVFSLSGEIFFRACESKMELAARIERVSENASNRMVLESKTELNKKRKNAVEKQNIKRG